MFLHASCLHVALPHAIFPHQEPTWALYETQRLGRKAWSNGPGGGNLAPVGNW